MTYRHPKKLITKIWLYMLLPTLLVLFAFNAALSLFFGRFSRDSAIRNTTAETERVASRFYETYTYIISRFISLTVSDDFRDDVKFILQQSPSSFTECNNLLQENFSHYIHIHELISSAILIREKDGKESGMYYPYTLRFKRSATESYRIPAISGITFLPSCENPYSGLGESIPMAVPLKYVERDNLIILPDQGEEKDLLFYLFFDTASISNFLQLYCNDECEGTLYLTDSTGRILSLPASSGDYQEMSREDVSESVSHMIREGKTCVPAGDLYLFCSRITPDGLYLINAVPESLFTQRFSYLRSVSLIIGITSTVFVAVLSIMLSFFITKPLKKLMHSLHSIETGNYRGKINISSNDEIEQLNDAIHSMYCTIQQQIRQIQVEETEKYETQMQLLSEQMNPHFLYNTLDFINMEIFCGHHDNASNMIANLGNYLRTGLAYGENLLTLSQEVEHALSYINIMNYRFSHMIQVTVQIPDPLLIRPIVKCILQPLVENSLKHGFEVNTAANYPFAPFITITAEFKEQHLEISVIDNGIGIDVERAQQVTKRKYAEGETGKHVGLNNVYSRLLSYYGEVDITFSSIPFFENKVSILLPAEYFTDTEDETTERNV